ncbi:MAG TPA: hypothetical protein VMT18_14890 [Planctomycetota bacterium]|nr:hypothetical protein [Planctomycetota bacterium]
MRPLALLLALCTACSTPPREPWSVQYWGSMREVLREGRTEGRVELARALGPHSMAVGASAGLGAEITVDRGAVHLVEVVDAAASDGVRERAPRPGERAALLVCADVPAWSEQSLPPVADLDALEALVRAAACARGLDAAAPFPFRVEGRAARLEVHVLDRSCPIASPEGPPPWRFVGEDLDVALVGFHADDSAGVLTHHARASHTHAVLVGRGLSGHLDEVALEAGARLFLPASESGGRL